MATRVYSTPFIQWTGGSGGEQYEVPADYTAVVRQISAQQTAGATSWYVFIQDSEEAPGLVIAAGDQEGFYNYGAKEGRWVVPPGGIITAAVETYIDGLSFYVGGYLLAGAL